MRLSKMAEEFLCEKFKDLNPHRLKHIYGVAKLAGFLANKYGIDEDLAMCAGFMHDYSKYDDFSYIETMLTDEEIKECRKYNFLYHAYASAYEYKKLFKDDFNIDVFNAIHNHVFGRTNMSKLEEIIMISDYCEEFREYESCKKTRKVLLDGNLYEAIVMSLSYTIDHVKEQGEIPHPEQNKVLEEYKLKLEELK